DRLKLRCFDEIAEELAKRKPAEPPTTPEEPDKPTVINDPPRKYKKTVNISIANILHGAKSIENEEDIERLLNDIRERLRSELKEDTIIKLV
ncbi:MAG: hypothetical protein GYA02_02115, partial [Clostridiaceae bacterium]|nr:hypothetical protein [Clostridiaceae bacterium]